LRRATLCGAFGRSDADSRARAHVFLQGCNLFAGPDALKQVTQTLCPMDSGGGGGASP